MITSAETSRSAMLIIGAASISLGLAACRSTAVNGADERLGNLAFVPQTPQRNISFSDYSPSRRHFLTVGSGIVKVWQSDGRLLLSVPFDRVGPRDPVVCEDRYQARGVDKPYFVRNERTCGFENESAFRISLRSGRVVTLNFRGEPIGSAGLVVAHKGPAGPFRVEYQGSTIRVFDGDNLIKTKGGESVVVSANISPDGRFLVGDFAQPNWGPTQTKLWNLTTGKLLAQIDRQFSGDNTYNLLSNFSPDSRYVLVEGLGRTVELLITDGTKVATLSEDGEKSTNAFFSADSQSVFSVGDGIRRWDLKGRVRQHFGSSILNIGSIDVSRSGDRIVLAGHRQGTALLADISLRPSGLVGKAQQCIQAVAISHDGRFVLTGGAGGTAILWDEKGKEIRTFSGHSGGFQTWIPPLVGGAGDCSFDVAISPDNRFVAIADGSQVQIWTLDGAFQRVFRSHGSSDVTSVRFIDSDVIVSASDSVENDALIWNHRTGEVIQKFRGNFAGRRVAVSRSGQLIIVGDKIFDRKGKVAGSLDGEVITAAFSPSESRIIACKNSGDCSFWHFFSGLWKEQCRLPDGQARVVGARFINEKAVLLADESGLLTIAGSDCSDPLFLAATTTGAQVFFDRKGQYLVRDPAALSAIMFRRGSNLYSFDQFDLWQNRPDEIIGRYQVIMGGVANRALLERYKVYVVHRRRVALGKQEVRSLIHSPEVQIEQAHGEADFSHSTFRFKFQMHDQTEKIIGYKIWVNSVPKYGDGFRRVDQNDRIINDYNVTVSEEVVLSEGDRGENKIEVSAITEDGVESARETIIATFRPPTPRKPDLYFVGIGIDDYDSSVSGGLDRLAYAVKDSKELEGVFRQAGMGRFGQVFTRVLTNKDVNRASIKPLRDFLAQSKVDDHVILFIAGHGIRKDTRVSDLLTAFGADVPQQYLLRNKSDIDDVYYYMTSDAHVDRPWEKAIPLDAIRDLVNGIPSRQKIMLVDTCQSGEKLDLDDATIAGLTKGIEVRKTRGNTARTRGINLVTVPGKENAADVEKKIVQTIAKSNVLKEMSELFPELRRGTGTIEISAATGVQSALESAEWKNGAFTYVIKEGILKGKARDANGNITARSLRNYVLEEVERLTDGQQTPMVARDIAGRDFVIFGK